MAANYQRVAWVISGTSPKENRLPPLRGPLVVIGLASKVRMFADALARPPSGIGDGLRCARCFAGSTQLLYEYLCPTEPLENLDEDTHPPVGRQLLIEDRLHVA